MSLRRSPRLEMVIAAIYAVVLLLVLVPYYNWFYRVGVNLLHLVAWVATLGIIIVLLGPRCLYERDLGRILVTVALGLVVVVAGLRVDAWRYAITHICIKSFYCSPDTRLASEEILGGIRQTRIEGEAGPFENTSHCLIVPCQEEFYYCSDAQDGGE